MYGVGPSRRWRIASVERQARSFFIATEIQRFTVEMKDAGTSLRKFRRGACLREAR